MVILIRINNRMIRGLEIVKTIEIVQLESQNVNNRIIRTP